MQESLDHIGVIKMIDITRGFGFIKCLQPQKDYYFKLNSLHEVVNPSDEVAFIVRKTLDKEVADAIRKIYTNNYGIKFIPRVNRTHIHEGVESYLPDIYERITEYSEDKNVQEFEFQSIVGQTICVTTDDNDVIFYAIRKGRLGHTRFVINREPQETNFITVILRKLTGYYQLISCYVGRTATYEPWDINASLGDLDFWNNHALIYGEEAIILESKTYDCPWVLNQPSICKLKTNPIQKNVGFMNNL